MVDRRDASTISLLVAFARSLRRAGVTVPVDNVVQYVRAIEAVGIGRRDPVYWAGRTVLIHRHEDVGTYDRVFDSFWWGSSGWTNPLPPSPEDTSAEAGHDEVDAPSSDGAPPERLAAQGLRSVHS